MNQPTILEMKQEAVRALMAYRRMKNTLLLHDAPGLLPEQAETMALYSEPLRAGRRRGRGAPLTATDPETMRCWVAAIDGARAALQRHYPLKARFMARCFGLDTPIPRYQSAHQRLIKLALELHTAESTLYKWREDIIELTLFGAIESGVLRPYGLRPGASGADQDSQPNSESQRETS